MGDLLTQHSKILHQAGVGGNATIHRGKVLTFVEGCSSLLTATTKLSMNQPLETPRLPGTTSSCSSVEKPASAWGLPWQWEPGGVFWPWQTGSSCKPPWVPNSVGARRYTCLLEWDAVPQGEAAAPSCQLQSLPTPCCLQEISGTGHSH